MAILFSPYFRATDQVNAPIPGAFATFYATGTSTLQAIWSEFTLGIPLANPIQADGNGVFPVIWLDDALPPYKVVLQYPDQNNNSLPGAIVAGPGGTIDPYNATFNAAAQVASLQPLLNPITLAEQSAGITPSNYSRRTEPYDIRREGAAVNNIADDTTALTDTLNVATQTVSGAQGAAITIPTGISLLSSLVTLPNRARVIGQNKRGSYFKAKLPFTGSWMFNAKNGTSSMFDSTLENVSVDAANIAGLGCVLSDAWQEDCGLRAVLLLNFATAGIKFQNGYGGASLTKIVDTEIFGGALGGQNITGITVAASAVVTVNTVSSANPFAVGSYVGFGNVAGMSQINGLNGAVTAVGGSSGAWTGTVNINSSGFSAYTSAGTAYTAVGIDLSTAMGSAASFMLDVSDTSITGGSFNLAAGIVVKGNSLFCRGVHFETATTGVLIDGAGYITLDDITGAGGGSGVNSLVTIASTFTGTLIMKNCRRNGATNFVNDLRAGGYGAIAGVDHPFFVIGSATEAAKGLPFASAWCQFDGTLTGTNAPAAGYNVASVTRNSVGNYSVTLLRPMLATASATLASQNVTTSGAQIATQLLSSSTFRIIAGVAGVATDAGEIKAIVFGG